MLVKTGSVHSVSYMRVVSLSAPYFRLSQVLVFLGGARFRCTQQALGVSYLLVLILFAYLYLVFAHKISLV